MKAPISNRLLACCDYIAPGDRVADVGCDHAYLPILLVQQGRMKQAIAMQDFGQPEDVAWALAFLASGYARYITGTTLEISGGKMGVQNPAKAWKDKETRG